MKGLVIQYNTLLNDEQRETIRERLVKEYFEGLIVVDSKCSVYEYDDVIKRCCKLDK